MGKQAYALQGHAQKKDNKDDMKPLYEAYSSLGRLQQEANLDISPPSILVVGHQTDGKSALIEALMGFQFNHVGGGTKTRRPIRLEMRYNPDCHEPKCELVNEENNKWEDKSLEDLQMFIAKENERLESDDTFTEEDIIVRMQYEFSPNITIIDTPGLIAAARDKPDMQRAAQQVEDIVVGKMLNPDYIILCLESQDDWANSSTRSVVMQDDVDPNLHRTVVVSTKLDTRLPQFGNAADVDKFISPTEHFNALSVLGQAPFFTSVPAMRVGSDDDGLQSNEEFVKAIEAQERDDLQTLEQKLRHPVSGDQQRRIGMSKLKAFLESLLLEKYIERLPKMMTVIQQQANEVESKLCSVKEQLRLMQSDNLKEQVWDTAMLLTDCLDKVGKGVAELPPDIAATAGSTLVEEVGEFQCQDVYGTLPDVSEYPDDLNGEQRLYGGAQLRRVKREVREVLKCMKFPTVNETDMLNRSGGMGDMHDGADVSQVAAGIALSAAEKAFRSILTQQLAQRNALVLKSMLQLSKDLALHVANEDSLDGRPRVAGIHLILERAVEYGEELIDQQSRWAADRVREDIRARVEYFTWEGLSSKVLQDAVNEILEPEMQVPLQTIKGSDTQWAQKGDVKRAKTKTSSCVSKMICGAQQQDATNLVTKLSRTIFEKLREELQDANVKFNSFLYKHVMKEMPKHLQKKMAAEDISSLLEVSSESARLEEEHKELLKEQRSVQELNKQFQGVKRRCIDAAPMSVKRRCIRPHTV